LIFIERENTKYI